MFVDFGNVVELTLSIWSSKCNYTGRVSILDGWPLKKKNYLLSIYNNI